MIKKQGIMDKKILNGKKKVIVDKIEDLNAIQRILRHKDLDLEKMKNDLSEEKYQRRKEKLSKKLEKIREKIHDLETQLKDIKHSAEK